MRAARASNQRTKQWRVHWRHRQVMKNDEERSIMSNVRLLSVVNTFSRNDPSPDSVGTPISFERRCFFFCFFFFFCSFEFSTRILSISSFDVRNFSSDWISAWTNANESKSVTRVTRTKKEKESKIMERERERLGDEFARFGQTESFIVVRSEGSICGTVQTWNTLITLTG